MPMPPNFRIGRRRLFISEDVLDWIKGQSTSGIKATQIQQSTVIPALRGRPTNANLMGHKK